MDEVWRELWNYRFQPWTARLLDSTKGGVFLSFLLSVENLFDNEPPTSPDGEGQSEETDEQLGPYDESEQEIWMSVPAREIEYQTGLSDKEQATIRKQLRSRGLLEERLRGRPATLEFRLRREELSRQAAAARKAVQKSTTGNKQSIPPYSRFPLL
ncbi:MAG: hypothetical protein ABI670_01135 [Chloroflexota bacterium]